MICRTLAARAQRRIAFKAIRKANGPAPFHARKAKSSCAPSVSVYVDHVSAGSVRSDESAIHRHKFQNIGRLPRHSIRPRNAEPLLPATEQNFSCPIQIFHLLLPPAIKPIWRGKSKTHMNRARQEKRPPSKETRRRCNLAFRRRSAPLRFAKGRRPICCIFGKKRIWHSHAQRTSFEKDCGGNLSQTIPRRAEKTNRPCRRGAPWKEIHRRYWIYHTGR